MDILLITEDAALAGLLPPMLQEMLGLGCRVAKPGEAGTADIALVDGDARPPAAKAVVMLKKPLRARELADEIARLAREINAPSRVALAAGWECDVSALKLVHPGSEAVALTEKEVAILALLHRAGGEAVTREAMLEKLWNFNDQVNTHTLETHIYRLRQKLKQAGGSDALVVNDAGGYRLCI